MTAEDSDRAQKEWLAGVFDRAAPTYDRVGDSYHDYFGARMVHVAEVGLRLFPDQRGGSPSHETGGSDKSPSALRGSHVLDVACGRGAVLLPAAACVGEGGSVVGVELSPEMARQARSAVLAAGVQQRVEVQVMDAQQLEFPDDSFDADVRAQLEHHEIVFATEDQWWDWHWSYSIRGVLEQVGEAACQAYRRADFEAMQPLREATGFPMRLTASFAFGRKP